jgi:hypothetical protein
MPESSNTSARRKLPVTEFIVGQHSLFFGAGGQACFYIHLFKPHLPVWAAVPFFMIPWAVVFVIFFSDRPLFSPREIRRYWLNAVCWYALFTVLAEGIWLLGYMPPVKPVTPSTPLIATATIQVLMNLGWLSFIPMIRDYIRNPSLWK